jgi:type IV secretory pathway TraG/TraD family ATPase VirD4
MKNPGFAGAVAGAGLAAVMLMAAGVDIDPARASNGVVTVFVVATMAGGFCGLGLRRGFLGASAGFWQTTVGRWLIGRIAGSAVYAALVALLWQLAVYAVSRCAIGLSYMIGWRSVLAIAPALPWLVWGVALTGAWFLRTPVKVFIGKASSPLRREYRAWRMGGGGSASYAGICEEWANRFRVGMIFFGHSLFDRHWPVGIRDDRMLLTLAGTGGGKGESALINNVLLHNGSMFINDPSGQIAAVTAEALRAKGFEVHIIDQMDVLGQGTARIDPLADLDPEARDYVNRLKQLVEAMSISSGNSRNRFFEDGGKTIVRGAIDYLIRRKGEEFTPPELLEEEAEDE